MTKQATSQAILIGKKILIVDDDHELCHALRLAYEPTGCLIQLAENGKVALKRFFDFRPDLVILDIMMPEMDGWEVCRQIRLLADTPIIMLTSRQADRDIVRGLEMGADDFVSKPFSPDVLLARMVARLRTSQQNLEHLSPALATDESLNIDLQYRKVILNGEPVHLTGTEFRLLAYLYVNAGIAVSYEQILDHVWEWDGSHNVHSVHVYVSQLRRKLEPDPTNPRFLLTEHGLGYRFVGTRNDRA